jgi:ferredoxin
VVSGTPGRSATLRAPSTGGAGKRWKNAENQASSRARKHLFQRILPVTYAVTELCVGCKHTTCVEVCPVDCFHEGSNFLAINPDECIDCGLCEPECPEEAIRSEADLGESELHLIDLNRQLAVAWPKITTSKPALPDAADWKGRPGRLALIIR